MRVRDLGEFQLIDRLLAQLRKGPATIILGPGDDAAAVAPTPGKLLLATSDSQVEGRHFKLDRGTAAQLGRRLAAVNLSDIAAMGGQPRWALISLCLPSSIEVTFVENFYSGLTAELARFDAQIIGGNLSGSEELILDLSLLGEVDSSTLMRRSGARVGDAIFVTGTLGASAAGRAVLDANLTESKSAQTVITAHLTPEARVAAGRVIAESRLASAMIDVSDGFAQDLGHICAASNCGFSILAESIPIAASTREVAGALGLDPLQWALTGGEDYELIVTAAEGRAAELRDSVEANGGVSLTRVGTVLQSAAGRWLEQADGSRVALAPGGWDHFGPAP
jgi:thiamine-monophosphate kinase